jgi:hypothetical protein
MATRKVFLDSKKSRSVILDEETATVVEDAVSGLMKTLDEANERADKAEAAKDEAEEKAEEAKKSTSDAAIGERVKLTLDTIASASKIVKNFDSKGLVSPLEIKRAALAQLKPTRDWSGKSEAYITAAFDSAEEDAKETTDEDDDEGAQATKDSLAGLARDLNNRPKATTDGSDSYNKFLRGEA